MSLIFTNSFGPGFLCVVSVVLLPPQQTGCPASPRACVRVRGCPRAVCPARSLDHPRPPGTVFKMFPFVSYHLSSSFVCCPLQPRSGRERAVETEDVIKIFRGAFQFSQQDLPSFSVSRQCKCCYEIHFSAWDSKLSPLLPLSSLTLGRFADPFLSFVPLNL